MTKSKAAKWTTGIIVVAALLYMIFPYAMALLDRDRNSVSKLTPQARTFDINGKPITAQVAYAAPSGMPSGAFGKGIFQQRKARLDQVVQYELPPDFVFFEGTDPAEVRDISVRVSPNDQKNLRHVLRKVAEEAYGVQIVSQKRMRKVYVLKQKANAKPLLQETHEGDGAYFIKPPLQNFKSIGIPMEEMITAFSHVLQIAIINETGLKGKYNIDFTFSDSSPERVMNDYATQAGLDVTLEERMVDVLVVRSQV